LVLAQQPLLQELYRITGGKVKSSCENRIQISRAGQSTFSPALTKYGSFAKIGYRPQELVSPHFRRRGFLQVG